MTGTAEYGVPFTCAVGGIISLPFSSTRKAQDGLQLLFVSGVSKTMSHRLLLVQFMLIIPAIDLKDGQCVRLKQGLMEQATVFSDSPAEMARHWLEQGARRLRQLT